MAEAGDALWIVCRHEMKVFWQALERPVRMALGAVLIAPKMQKARADAWS
jgi:hypothetical protein